MEDKLVNGLVIRRYLVAVLLALSILSTALPFVTTPSCALPSSDWGNVETFDGVATGTTSNFNDVALFPTDSTDLVVLDGKLWVMFRGNESARFMTYSPSVPSESWNLSFEAYAPREGSSYYGIGVTPGIYSIKAMLPDGRGSYVTGIELKVAPNGLEGVYIYQSDSWEMIVGDILPAYPNFSNDSDSQPDRYITSFRYQGGNVVKVMVWHTGAGLVLSQDIVVHGKDLKPVLDFYDEVLIKPFIVNGANYGWNGGWFIDDLSARPSDARYVVSVNTLEKVDRREPLWLELRDQDGSWIEDANVSIGGVDAMYDPSGHRYMADVIRSVGWAQVTPYEVRWDGTIMNGTLKVTTTFNENGVRISDWWNGWQWASVLGLDDCSGPETAISHYYSFDHPTTAYISDTAGHSGSVLGTQSEIAIHYPHDYREWMKKSWSESVVSATDAQTAFDAAYEFASLWDDPSYVGAGDTYISLANPGNSATYQMMYAQFMAGVRIEGRSSLGNGIPGNSSLLGSYWPLNGVWGVPGTSWYPDEPMDLMDACRQYSLDNPDINVSQMIEVFKEWAADGVLLRLYAHPEFDLNSPGYSRVATLLDWVIGMKENGLENWKTTDGEAASYIYSRWSTGVEFNEQESVGGEQVYDIKRADPCQAGYWLVPLTLEFNLYDHQVSEITVIDGDGTEYRMTDGSLRDLGSARVMATGYDIRDGILYVSQFWNGSAQIRLRTERPYIMNQPSVLGLVDQEYRWTANAMSSDAGTTNWSFDNSSAPWLRSSVEDEEHCTIIGTPAQVGDYPVSLTVRDDDSFNIINWTVRIGTEPDTTAPTTVLNSSSAMWRWSSRPVTLEFDSTDEWSGVSRILVSINNDRYQVYHGPFTVSKEAWHSISYYAVDRWGNVENRTTVQFGVDLTMPYIWDSIVNDTVMPKDRAVFNYRIYDQGSGIDHAFILIDGVRYDLNKNDGQIDLASYRFGEVEIEIVVLDRAGNEASSTYQLTVSSIPADGALNDPVMFFVGCLLIVVVLVLFIRNGLVRKGR